VQSRLSPWWHLKLLGLAIARYLSRRAFQIINRLSR
jgi:hypothetical protein